MLSSNKLSRMDRSRALELVALPSERASHEARSIVEQGQLTEELWNCVQQQRTAQVEATCQLLFDWFTSTASTATSTTTTAAASSNWQHLAALSQLPSLLLAARVLSSSPSAADCSALLRAVYTRHAPHHAAQLALLGHDADLSEDADAACLHAYIASFSAYSRASHRCFVRLARAAAADAARLCMSHAAWLLLAKGLARCTEQIDDAQLAADARKALHELKGAVPQLSLVVSALLLRENAIASPAHHVVSSSMSGAGAVDVAVNKAT